MGCSLAVVGATGLVGRTMLRVLEERSFPADSLRLLASPRSAGEVVRFGDNDIMVEAVSENCFHDVDVALFSAGSAASLRLAPLAVASQCIVIDNSSAWRMHEAVPLVVPEVNSTMLMHHHGIIANPNCSTIELVVALAPLHSAFGIRRVVVSTYQSVSGAGQTGVRQMEEEIIGRSPEHRISSHPVAYNLVFHTVKEMNGASEEETKMMQETRKIMGIPLLPMSVTCVRAPILGGHGESVNIEFESAVTPDIVRELLEQSPGIRVIDDPSVDAYPTPLQARDRDEVFVGRIRRDSSVTHGINMWIVADNLRKGAATNAVQIAEHLVSLGLPSFDPSPLLRSL